MRGSVSRSHTAWASASARAKRRRGRCTEKPRPCNIRGTWWLWYRTPKRCAIRSPIMGPIQTLLVYPAALGPKSINVVSSSRWAVLSLGVGPGGIPVTSPSTPSASYHCSHRLTDPRVTSSSAARSTTRRPSRYPSTPRARRQTSRSLSLRASSRNRRNVFRAAAERPAGLIASPFLHRPMTTSRVGDRDTVILLRSQVNPEVDLAPRDPV